MLRFILPTTDCVFLPSSKAISAEVPPTPPYGWWIMMRLFGRAKRLPFVPAVSLPRVQDVGSHVTLWQPEHGGHVGFPRGTLPGHVRTLPDEVGRWLGDCLPA